MLKTIVCGEGEIRRVRLGELGRDGSGSRGETNDGREDEDEDGGGGRHAQESPRSGEGRGFGALGGDTEGDEEESEGHGHGIELPADCDWAGWEGEVIPREKQISVGGFRAAGLAVRVCHLVSPHLISPRLV